MATSESKRLRSKRRWIVVSGDASLNFGRVLSTHKTEDDANKARPMFGTVRIETTDEVAFRLQRPDLPMPCRFKLDFRDYGLVARELWRLDNMGACTTILTGDQRTVLDYGHDIEGARRFQSAAFSLQIACEATTTEPWKLLAIEVA